MTNADLKQMREKWENLVRFIRFTHATEATNDIFMLLDAMNATRTALKEIGKHLSAIAESPCAMGGTDIEHLELARELIENAL